MTSLEKVVQALGCETPQNVVPTAPIVFAWAAKQRGIAPAQFLSDPAAMSDSLLWSRERFGYDAVYAFGGTTLEPEAMGSKLDYNSAGYPDIVEYAVSKPSDILRLPVPDPSDDGRLPVLLEAISRMHAALGGDAPILSLVLGPTTIASQLVGLEDMMWTAADDRPLFDEILRYLADVTVRVAAAVAEAGATTVAIADPSACPEIIPAWLFAEAVAPIYKQIVAGIREICSAPVGLYIPGDLPPIFPALKEIQFDYIYLHHTISPADARAALPGVCLAGNARPYSFTASTPEEMATIASQLVKTARDIGGFILSTGSEIPLDANPANVEAFVRAAVS